MAHSYFHIYGKQRCKFCSKAKKLLKDESVEFIWSDMTRAKPTLEILKGWTTWETVPLVFHVLGEKQYFVGGCSELESYLRGEESEEAEEVEEESPEE